MGEVSDGELGFVVVEESEAVGEDTRDLFAFQIGYGCVFVDFLRFHFYIIIDDQCIVCDLSARPRMRSLSN